MYPPAGQTAGHALGLAYPLWQIGAGSLAEGFTNPQQPQFPTGVPAGKLLGRPEFSDEVSAPEVQSA